LARAAVETDPPAQAPVEPDPAVQAAVATVPGWFHSLDVGGGVVTPGHKSPATLAGELAILGLPDLRGKSVLDIGAWDGYFSFACERLGASRVVALDHFAWSVDFPALARYNEECRQAGIAPEPHETVPGVWQPDTLPGKQGFDTARRLLGSRVDSVVGDFMTMDLAPLGQFDVVLFLGVLYHLREPFEALRRLAQVTRDLAVVESVCAVVPGMGHHALVEFLESDELNGDPTNWWAPNRKALMGMARAAGFRSVDCPVAPPEDAAPVGYEWHYGRAVMHARKGS
jgi:tRNA (mo5U34)-methyltransferase